MKIKALTNLLAKSGREDEPFIIEQALIETVIIIQVR